MTWSWRLEGVNGEPVEGGELGDLGRHEFGSRSDAESWIGETWRELLDAGVEQVRLFDADREVYGPMSLRPPDET